MKKVIVASTNPVKIESAQIGFAKMFPEESFEVQGIAAPSEISAQPMSSDETLLGATNLVHNVSNLVTAVDYRVGIEGGIEDVHEELEVFAWVVVKAANGKIGKGKTGSFFLPQEIAKLVRQGIELGEADVPENSWSAIQLGHQLGADLLEVDVQMSCDGVPFLRHNYQLPDGRWCHDVSWSELMELKIDGEPLPKLEDVLVWARDVDVILSLDIKNIFK